MRFIWDPKKAAENLAKHSVSFEEASTAFGDKKALYVPDEGHPERGNLIGHSASTRLLFEVHIQFLVKSPSEARLISARKANSRQRSRYESQIEPSTKSSRRKPRSSMKKTDVRNPFYEEIQRNGIIIDVSRLNEDPSTPARNPYYARAAGGIHLYPPGRPRRGEARRPTVVRSVRLPPGIWKQMQAQAKREGISLNAAMRQAAQLWLRA